MALYVLKRESDLRMAILEAELVVAHVEFFVIELVWYSSARGLWDTDGHQHGANYML